MARHSTFPPPAQATAPIDGQRLAELQSTLGEVRLAALLHMLLAECRDRPPMLRSGHGRDDLSGVRAGAVSLGAAALSVGATALGQAAERLGSAPDLAAAATMIEALDDAARATLGALHGLLGYSSRLYAVA